MLHSLPHPTPAVPEPLPLLSRLPKLEAHWLDPRASSCWCFTLTDSVERHRKEVWRLPGIHMPRVSSLSNLTMSLLLLGGAV